MPVNINGTSGIANATWTTGTRPSSPVSGQTGFNTTTALLETYNGAAWTSGSGGLSWQTVQTTGFTAVSGNAYPCNTTSAAFTVTLPASPSAGDAIILTDYAGTFATNNLTVNPNGNKLQSNTSNATVATNRISLNIVYIDATQGWIPYATAYTSGNPLPQSYTLTYLAVAGGGGSVSFTGTVYNSGGAGAGGFLSGTTSLSPGISYTVTVGGGGSVTPTGFGGSGSNSVISGGTISTVTALGGGGAGGAPGTSSYGQPGGSGGGGGGGATNPGGSGTPGQGNNGGSGLAGVSGGGGGGGGASAAGNNCVPGTSGAGGSGSATSITGTPATYAGGGSGGADSRGCTAGAAGAGGGGQGSTGSGTSGTTNTGGGGGGQGYPGGTAGSGGSGRVVLSVPTSNYPGTTTGSPTVTTNGANTVLTYLGSGTYTA